MLKRRSLLAMLTAVGLALLLVGVVFASQGGTEIQGYVIDLVEVTEDGNQSTWVYAVTASGSVPKYDLSHWSLGIGGCYELVKPPNGSIYTTPINDYGCGSRYTCTEGDYKVVHEAGMGGQATITDGIKFDSQNRALGRDNMKTQIFTFTIQKEDEQDFRLGETYIDLKMGTHLYKDTFLGPVCAPNPVTIVALEAGGRPAYWGIAGLVGVVVIGLGWRRRFRERDR